MCFGGSPVWFGKGGRGRTGEGGQEHLEDIEHASASPQKHVYKVVS